MRNGTLRFVTFSGMTIPLTESDEVSELRSSAARYLQDARERGSELTTLERGSEWEIITESNRDGIGISDADGVLRLSLPEPEFAECWTCGDEFERDSCHECESFEDEPPFGSFPEERSPDYPYADLQGMSYASAIRELSLRQDEDA
jgi:hypothetical protein